MGKALPEPGERVYDLVEVIAEGIYERKTKVAVVNAGIHDEIARMVKEVTERLAREMIPDIAERIIREEIEKLKQQ
ncbi:MAG: hypothetical protein N2Z74_02880 [Syntrophales bacterium]|nr:hypothetical protein [Syntrophales bacterium]